MGKHYKSLTSDDQSFIAAAKLFFLASCSAHEVNLSPKGYDCLRVLDATTLLYLDYPGSGNRTARDIEEAGRATLMWCAFEGAPKILRCFCRGELIEPQDAAFEAMLSHFPGVERNAVRRLIRFDVDAVESSCGMSVPLYMFERERDTLREWAVDMAASGKLKAYIAAHQVPPEL